VNTTSPLVQINDHWLVKMDCFLSGHSHKSRAADYIVQRGIADGSIVPGTTTLIEKTGGNFGLGLVLSAAKHNLNVDLAIGLGFSKKKRDFLSQYGANLIGVEMLLNGLQPKDVVQHHLEHQESLGKNYFYTDQFNNVGSLEAHEHITGPEIVDQIASQYPNIQHIVFVACAGTGAHATGVSYAIRRAGYGLSFVLVEPNQCNTLNHVHEKHGFEGMNVGVFPPFLDVSLISDIAKVKEEDALKMRKHFAIQHGFYVGMTSAACLSVAQRLSETLKGKKDTLVLNMVYDLGFWYS
jgi:cysteine synthase